MGFDDIKMYHMNKLKDALRKNLVDEPIIDLLNTINDSKDYFTTSSCAGRIVLMKIPKSGKKNEAEFLFKSHYPVNSKDIWNTLLENYHKFEEKIYFKQEPFILHIAARDIKKAHNLLQIAIESGLKHSGIFAIKKDRVMIEIQSTERIETIVSKNRKILVNEDYINVLVEEANEKLMRTREKMYKFQKNFIRFLKWVQE